MPVITQIYQDKPHQPTNYRTKKDVDVVDDKVNKQG